VREVLYRAVALGAVIVIGIVIIIAGAVILVTGQYPQLSAGAPAASTTVPTAIATVTATLSLPPTTAPVEFIPSNLQVSASIEPKSIGGLVTINYLGGRGRAQVREMQARLTQPDGTVVTGSVDAQTEFPQIVLQGSKGTDQVEVFVLMTSGKTYKILDQKVIYPSRY
jgi:hypothetical protein